MLDEIPQVCHILAASGGVTSTFRLPNQSRRRRAFMAASDVSPQGGNPQSKTEIWKPVPSEPGVLASSWGRVLLPPRYAPMWHGGYRAYFPEPQYGQVAKAQKTAKHEYMQIMVRRDGGNVRQTPRKVHQLICEAFHGPKPFTEAVVIHLDENALNNWPENLKWGTQKENLNMPKVKAYHASRRGDMSAVSVGKRRAA
jgi:HNH endonuclease